MMNEIDRISADVANIADCAKESGAQKVVVDFRELGRVQRLAYSVALVDAWCIATMAGKKFVVPKQPH